MLFMASARGGGGWFLTILSSFSVHGSHPGIPSGCCYWSAWQDSDVGEPCIDNHQLRTMAWHETTNRTQLPKNISYLLSPPHLLPSSFLSSSPSCMSVSVCLSACLSAAETWAWRRNEYVHCFPHVNSQGGSRGLRRSITEQHLLHEKTRSNQRFLFGKKVKICSSRKSPKVSWWNSYSPNQAWEVSILEEKKINKPQSNLRLLATEELAIIEEVPESNISVDMSPK